MNRACFFKNTNLRNRELHTGCLFAEQAGSRSLKNNLVRTKGAFCSVWLFILMMLVANQYAIGQIVSNADTVVRTRYSVNDSILIFYTVPTQLAAVCPKGTDAVFEWSRFGSDKVFKLPEQTDTATKSSVYRQPITEGGYKVRIKDTLGLDTSFVRWVFVDTFSFKLRKDSSGYLIASAYDCNNTTFSAYLPALKTFDYYNPANGDLYTLKNGLTGSWVDSTQVAPQWQQKWLYFRLSSAPYKEQTYKVEVKDSFGFVVSDSIKAMAFTTKADFTWKAKDPEHFVIDGSLNSAPFEVIFTNNSINGTRFQYYWGDQDTSAWVTDTSRQYHTYYIPRTAPYHVTLVSKVSYLGGECTDSISTQTDAADRNDILISPSQINKDGKDKAPNMFVVGRENFKFYTISIGSYRVQIFSRWGTLVKNYEGQRLEEWEGWDGRTDRGNEAVPGLYYYVLEGQVLDPKPNTSKVNTNGRYTGFFYLFRQN
jgi:hypothetical protein